METKKTFRSRFKLNGQQRLQLNIVFVLFFISLTIWFVSSLLGFNVTMVLLLGPLYGIIYGLAQRFGGRKYWV